MRYRQILLTIVIAGTLCQAAAAQPRKKKIYLDAPPVQGIQVSTSIRSDAVLSELMEFEPEMPLGPQDILKSYEIAMNMVADKTSSDFVVIVQAHKANQITRGQAEYLLQESYEMAMMQFQVLSALHDVLEHEIDEAARQDKQPLLKTTGTDAVLVVPFPNSDAARK